MAVPVTGELAPSGRVPLTVDELGLETAGDLNYEEWAALGARIAHHEHALRWAIGDWLLYGQDRFRDYRAAVLATGLHEHSLAVCATVARQVPRERRHPGLSWSHHDEVAALAGRDQTRLLRLAEGEGLSKMALRALIRQEEEDRQLACGYSAGGKSTGDDDVDDRHSPQVTFTVRASVAPAHAEEVSAIVLAVADGLRIRFQEDEVPATVVVT